MATLVLFPTYAATGFATLSDGRGDNDSMMRLVEVRDLLGGQGWFDLQQYRLGFEGGIPMHWSRLVDAPIAGLILLAGAFGATAAGAETFAAIVWPLLLFFLALLALLHAAARIAGSGAILPAAVIASVTLYYIGIFAPGAIDHHNVQLALTLGMIAGLLSGDNRFWLAAGAGACAALMLAVGMETAPYVAVGGLCASLLYLLRGETERLTATGFGLGFGCAATLAFLFTVPFSSWLRPACDAFSAVQFTLAAVGGFGLAGVASSRNAGSSLARRVIALAVLGAGVSALLVLVFPGCLSNPYAMVDPWLRENWLDEISEAQSFLDVARDNPAKLLLYYGYGLMALGVLLFRWKQETPRRADLIVIAMLAAALVISIWQIRGSLFLLPFSAIPLAGWVARARLAARLQPTARTTGQMAGAWILSFVVTWILISAGVNSALAALSGSEAPPMAPQTAHACYRPSDYSVLAKETPATVLSFTNLGSAILRNTPHRALAGPYHRNSDGNLFALQTLLAAPDDARAAIAGSGATILAWCAGNSEAGHLAALAPESIAAMLNQNEAPEWLTPMPVPLGSDLVLYRITPAS
ncbi:GtrA family protein [Tianweitania sediminis]|uniref:GtrA family protein n=1 Tax=Tianweitania sediminis TaxID=1502156 RepID=A0A8J7QZX3_9HYPH|nr:GtrA family protein [Tianweitania sediminis]MBP0437500.1 GtrA family protein [Tianweitania sediminis]